MTSKHAEHRKMSRQNTLHFVLSNQSTMASQKQISAAKQKKYMPHTDNKKELKSSYHIFTGERLIL